jgi:mannose PTS system EIIA component
LETVTIGPDDDMDSRREDILAAVKSVNSGEGVVVLTDMFGGTPSNLALSCMNGGSVEVVAGINLPLLIKLASVRDEKPLVDAVNQAQEAGRKYIKAASSILAGK